MENFIFHTPTKIYFGKEQEKGIGGVLKEFNAHRVLIHYGQSSVVKTGLLKRIKAYLDEQNIKYFELGGVKPNPELSKVLEGIDLVKKENIDFVLAIGGGSVIDSSKSICVGAVVNHSPWEFSLKIKQPKASLPLGVILTISASGSDMSDSCVITNNQSKEKRGFNSPYNRPKFAILNPELTYTVSPYQTSCGTVDILMHTLERYICNSSPLMITDEIAIGLLKSVIKAGRIVLEDPTNYEARATLMWANSLSHNGLTSCGSHFVMSVHQLEHELSGMFDKIAHGAGLAALWPSWARVAYPSAKDKFLKLAREVAEVHPSGNDEADILDCIQWFENYFKEIGMPTSLKELDVPKDTLKELAVNVTFNHTRVIHDVVDVDESTAYKIYKLAYEA